MKQLEKRLILVRHAKSSWKHPGLSDFDRPLNKRGVTDGSLMAEEMKRRIERPDRLISSDSRRTRETADYILHAYGLEASKIRFDRRLYEADVETIGEVIAQVSDAFTSLLVLGHNPGITQFHNRLLPRDPLDNIPTFGVADIRLAIQHWREVLLNPKAERSLFIYPRLFRDRDTGEAPRH